MDTNEFYKSLEIEDSDRERAEKYLKVKGLFFHMQIKKKLLAWTEGETVKYAQIASFYRYDKRIRNVLYKYIAYLEEYYRAVILDAYFDNTEQDFWIPEIKEKIDKNMPLNTILEELEFRKLIKQMKQMPDEIKQKCDFWGRTRLNENAEALIVFRNAVMHNKFLLMYKGFSGCFLINGKVGASLRDNIFNLISFLPQEVGEKLKEDINGCKKNRNREGETKWDLPQQVIVSLEQGGKRRKKHLRKQNTN